MTPSSKANPLLFLEVQADGELQFPHGRAAFEGGDLPVVATLTINAAVGSIVLTEGIDGMIENVEGIHAELRTEPLEDLELLYHRHIGVEARRAMVGVAA